ncbi:MAG: AraC family transcriptional regulator [Nocardioides sp.]|nr:AraC family transcriptional regulator [Nocardioides sp.]
MGTEGYPDAVVRPRSAEQAFDMERLAPSSALAGHLDYHWYVAWHLEPGATHEQQIIPQPRVHIAAEDGRLLVHGVLRTTFTRRLAGHGHVLGASFLPGMFRPLLRASVATLADRAVPAGDLLGLDDRPAAAAILAGGGPASMVASLEAYLGRFDLPDDPVAEQVRDLVALAESDRTITRAEQLASTAGLGLRTLQRLFSEYVGVGPKWVVQRFRILEVAGHAHHDEHPDWAALAAELDFSDQAHLVRVFREVVGRPPAAYARDL